MRKRHDRIFIIYNSQRSRSVLINCTRIFHSPPLVAHQFARLLRNRLCYILLVGDYIANETQHRIRRRSAGPSNRNQTQSGQQHGCSTEMATISIARSLAFHLAPPFRSRSREARASIFVIVTFTTSKPPSTTPQNSSGDGDGGDDSNDLKENPSTSSSTSYARIARVVSQSAASWAIISMDT